MLPPSAARASEQQASPRLPRCAALRSRRLYDHADPLVELLREKLSWGASVVPGRSPRRSSSDADARSGPGSAPKWCHFRKRIRLITHRWPLRRSAHGVQGPRKKYQPWYRAYYHNAALSEPSFAKRASPTPCSSFLCRMGLIGKKWD